MKTSKPIIRLLSVALIALAGLMGLHAYYHVSLDGLLSWPWFVISLILHVLIYWLGSLGWIRILAECGLTDQAELHRKNYWLSLPLQFMGGFVGTSLGRIWLSRNGQVKNKPLVYALMIEKGLTGVYGLLGIVTLTAWEWGVARRPGVFWVGIISLTGVLIVGLGIYYAAGDRKSPIHVNKLRIAALYLGCLQACDILALITLALALGVHAPVAVLMISRAYIVSYLIGQLVFIIPQGLGIREALFVYMLHASAGIPWPVQYALCARLLAVGGQLLPILLLSGTWIAQGDSLPPAD
jgi:hypothetical protein